MSKEKTYKNVPDMVEDISANPIPILKGLLEARQAENASLKAEVDGEEKRMEDKCSRCVGVTQNIALKAEGKKLKERMSHWGTVAAEKHAALTASEQRVKDLENDLRTARDAIAQAPEDAFGHVDETSVDEGWWIRDELVANFSQTLDGAEHDDAALSDTERGE